MLVNHNASLKDQKLAVTHERTDLSLKVNYQAPENPNPDPISITQPVKAALNSVKLTIAVNPCKPSHSRSRQASQNSVPTNSVGMTPNLKGNPTTISRAKSSLNLLKK